VAVHPYFKNAEEEERVTLFEHNFNIRQFISEVPFMSDGGKFDEDDVSRQQKRKTIFTVNRAFPYLTSRIPVIHSEDIILSPIECAIEMMQRRVDQFKSEVYCSPVRKNNLQALLTGTLATTVHVGPLKFCECFLESKEFEVHLQNQLRERMAEMLLLAKRALQINAAIISAKQLTLQEVLEEKFATIMQTFKDKYQGEINWTKISAVIATKTTKH